MEYADAELHKYGPKKPSVRHLVKVICCLQTSRYALENQIFDYM